MAESVVLTVRVIPRSSKSEIVDFVEGVLKVRLKSPPVDGAANAELIKLLAKTFRVSRSAVTLMTGASSRTKRISIDGIATIDEILRA